jgi:hypothetical protein
MRRTLAIVCSLPFLAALAVLLINDIVLKAAFPGWLTGKLSDLAGVAMVGMLSNALTPSHRTVRYGVIGGSSSCGGKAPHPGHSSTGSMHGKSWSSAAWWTTRTFWR